MGTREGLFVNGEHVYIQSVNQHHDLGALGAAFNKRAAKRRLESCARWERMPSGWPTIRPLPSCSI